MRVGLLTVRSQEGCTLKDVAGGFGTAFAVGRSWPARLLERAKGALAELPPLLFGTLSAQLRSAGHRVVAAELDRRPGRRPTALPEVDVAILLSSIVDEEAERALLQELRRAKIRSIVVGAYATARPERYLELADLVVRGEAEALGAELLDPGLPGPRPGGAVEAGYLEDLDALPLPDWSPFPVERYRYALLSLRGPTLPIASARGCAFGCGYCPWRVTAPFRQREPEAVAIEARALKERYGATALAFRDPLFNLDRDRVLALAAALAPLGLLFSAEMRADRLDAEMLRRLRAAGLRSLEIGVESVDRALLSRQKRKPPEREAIEAVVREAQAMGIRVICNYMIGLPEDDEARIRETVRWAKSLNSFAVQFTIATPYPGTTLEEEVRARRLPLLGGPPTGFRPTFAHPTISPERLEALREWAYVSYHLRPRYLWRFATHAGASMWESLGSA